MNATKLSPLFASTFVAASVAISGIAGAQSSVRIDVTPYRANANRLIAAATADSTAGGITAEVLVVNSFDDLHARAADARGEIVVYDVPFGTTGDPFENYRRVVRYRAAPRMMATTNAIAQLLTPISATRITAGGSCSLRSGDGGDGLRRR